MSYKPEIGEQVVVIGLNSGGVKPDNIEKLLEIGDVIKIAGIYDDQTALYYISTGYNYILFEDIAPFADSLTVKEKKCSCDILVLMNSGCKCGAMLYEQN